MRICIYHAAAFLGSFLLFAVQPMTSKSLLPRYGGSYLVWAGSMVFFQGLLLAGYLYAHWVNRVLGCVRAARLHAILVLLPLLLLPPGAPAAAAGADALPLVAGVFADLWRQVGVPFILLSTVSLMLQRWLHVSALKGAANPYVLYAASNAGSVAALLAYPLVVEPVLDIRAQAAAWTAGYAVLAVLLLACLPWCRRAEETQADGGGASIGRGAAGKLLALSGAACGALLAVTNLLTFDVASIPFLWVLPLTVYMMAFVLSFKRNAWRPAWLGPGLDWALAVGLLLSLMGSLRLSVPLPASLLLHLGVLGVICLSCTDALIGLRPRNASELTGYYLWIAVGGLAGSLVVGWILPVVSRSLVEYPLFLAFTSLALGWSRGKGWSSDLRSMGARLPAAAAVMILSLTLFPWIAGKCFSAQGAFAGMIMVPVAVPAFLAMRAVKGRPHAVGLLLLCSALAVPWTESLAGGSSTVLRLRNYYGIYRVFDREGLRYLQHGTTQHGRQYLSGPRRGTPLSYHHPSTPGGRVMSSAVVRRNRVHMIGLGTGAMSAYMGPGSELTIFELDPDNIPIARRFFSYLDDAERRGARLRFVVGDGRVRLGERPDGECDVLVVDAFSSGSIPVHLLTVEALAEYARVIRPDGLLLMHVSNRYLTLQPVVAANAAAAGLDALAAGNAENVHPDADLTEWVAVFRPDNAAMRGFLIGAGWREPAKPLPRPWTDQYANFAAAWLGFGK